MHGTGYLANVSMSNAAGHCRSRGGGDAFCPAVLSETDETTENGSDGPPQGLPERAFSPGGGGLDAIAIAAAFKGNERRNGYRLPSKMASDSVRLRSHQNPVVGRKAMSHGSGGRDRPCEQRSPLHRRDANCLAII
nr:hypothetical protein Iba_chr04aCG6070 [Ipomoea batatas]